jgi:hypothetical protein
LLVLFARPFDRRVDLRDAFPEELSRPAPPFFAARGEVLRFEESAALTLRSVALTPGLDVSTTGSRRGRFGAFAFFGPDRCTRAWNRSAFVGMVSISL